MDFSNRNSEQQTPSPRLKGSQINWNQVFYFSEIASAGSIRDAARKLELNPSTLSLHLSQLEEDLHVQLFVRHHRRLALTPEGTRLYLHAKAMFEAGQRLVDVVSPLPLGCYPLSVAIVPSSSLDTANRILAMYLSQQKLTNMKVLRTDYATLEKGMVENTFDFGFSDRAPERKNISHTLITESTIRFYVSQKWEGAPLKELLSSLPLLVCTAEPKTRTLAEQLLVEQDLPPAAVVTSDYHSTLLDLCHNGCGVGVLSETAVKTSNARNPSGLIEVTGAETLKDKLYVLWASGAENTAAVKALQLTLNEFKSQKLSR